MWANCKTTIKEKLREARNFCISASCCNAWSKVSFNWTFPHFLLAVHADQCHFPLLERNNQHVAPQGSQLHAACSGMNVGDRQRLILSWLSTSVVLVFPCTHDGFSETWPVGISKKTTDFLLLYKISIQWSTKSLVYVVRECFLRGLIPFYWIYLIRKSASCWALVGRWPATD